MFDQNKEWVKFRQQFRGLKRGHLRAKKPNQMTEYDVPINHVSRGMPECKGAECTWDPDEILMKEFDKDEEKQKQIELDMFGEVFEPAKIVDENPKNIF